MEQHSSGVKFEVYSNEHYDWMSVKKGYFEEGNTYRFQIITDKTVSITFDRLPLALERLEDGYEVFITMPFFSGKSEITLQVGNHQEKFPIFIYPDSRKLTMDNYFSMIQEIMEEAAVCFQETSTYIDVETQGKSRSLSWLQWNYIEQCFSDLKKLFSKLSSSPMKRLYRRNEMQRREKIKVMESGTFRWLERQGSVDLNDAKSIPEYLLGRKTFETNNIYENQMVKTQLMQLRYRLRAYENITTGRISEKAKIYGDMINHWLNRSYLKKVDPVQGSLRITQGMKKHPLYSLWYEWFEKLHSFKDLELGLSKPIPISETYLVYEIWCYMKLVKWFRERGLVKNSDGLYRVEQKQLFLELAKGSRSEVRLIDGRRLIYQRSYPTFGEKNFRSYTHMMIPDIVLESKEEIIVFDPKYRVEHNLSNALGEMHKYRDGIIDSEGKRCVKGTFIFTPTSKQDLGSNRLFSKDYFETYHMGAFPMSFETDDEDLDRLLGHFI